MSITPDQIKTIRVEFYRLKPARVRLDGSRPLIVREATFALAPTLERMRRRGFELAEQTEKLHDKDIELRVPTLPGISTHGTAEGEKARHTPAQLNGDCADIRRFRCPEMTTWRHLGRKNGETGLPHRLCVYSNSAMLNLSCRLFSFTVRWSAVVKPS